MVAATRTTLDMAEGVPVLGHAKGLGHYVCGDVEGGKKAMVAATRTTAVMVAGAGGSIVADPVGAVAAGVATGAAWDVTAAVVTDGEEVNGVAKIIENPKDVGAYWEAAVVVVCDGLSGHAGGKIAEQAVKPKVNAEGPKVRPAVGEKAASEQMLVKDCQASKNVKWNKMEGGFRTNAKQVGDVAKLTVAVVAVIKITDVIVKAVDGNGTRDEQESPPKERREQKKKSGNQKKYSKENDTQSESGEESNEEITRRRMRKKMSSKVNARKESTEEDRKVLAQLIELFKRITEIIRNGIEVGLVP